MADYILTRFVTQAKTLDAVLALIETHIETVVNTVTIRMYGTVLEGHEWHGYIVYDTP